LTRRAIAVLAMAWSAAAAGMNFPPVASASASPAQVWVGEAVQLSSAGSLDPDSSPAGLTFSWDFGDGSAPSTLPDPLHTYSRAGAFTVTLTVFDGAATSLAGATVTVLARPTPTPPTRSGPLALDGAELWVVNPDSNSVSLLDLSTSAVTEIPVGRAPRSLALSLDGARVIVACSEDGALWLIDRPRRAVSGTVPVGHRPFGVAAIRGGSRVAVTLEAGGELVLLDVNAPAAAARIPLAAVPRALAVSHDGRRAFVTHFLTRGDVGRVSVVDLPSAAVLREVDLVEDPGPDTPSSGRGFPNLLGSVAIEPSGEGLWVGGLKSNTGRGLYVNGLPLVPLNRLRGLLARIDGTDLQEALSARIDTEDADSATGIAFSPDGRHGFALHQGAGRLSVYDLPAAAAVSRGDGTTIPHLARVDVGEAPHGIVLSQDGTRAYVANYLSRDVAVLDVQDPAAPVLLRSIPVTSEPLPPEVARGKRLFYRSRDPVHSLQSYIACASCHPDGAADGRTWDFTQSGEGLRNTIDLRGHGGMAHGPVHWSANFDEIQDFENDIRHAFQGTGLMSDDAFNEGTRAHPLGDRKAGISADLDALAIYLASLDRYPRSPYRTADGHLTASARRGRALFRSARLACTTCHRGAPLTDSGFVSPGGPRLHDVGTLRPGSGRRLGEPLLGIDTPTLYDLAASAPYLHDGSAATVGDVLGPRNPADRHGVTRHLGRRERSDLEAYLLSIDAAGDN